MSKPHGSNPRSRRETRHRNARYEREQRLAQRRAQKLERRHGGDAYDAPDEDGGPDA